MRELLRTNDSVRLSWLHAMLASAGIDAVILDTHTSIIEGSIGAIPRRLMVQDEDETRARAVLKDVESRHEP
jgi:putative signal transducing protein